MNVTKWRWIKFKLLKWLFILLLFFLVRGTPRSIRPPVRQSNIETTVCMLIQCDTRWWFDVNVAPLNKSPSVLKLMMMLFLLVVMSCVVHPRFFFVWSQIPASLRCVVLLESLSSIPLVSFWWANHLDIGYSWTFRLVVDEETCSGVGVLLKLDLSTKVISHLVNVHELTKTSKIKSMFISVFCFGSADTWLTDISTWHCLWRWCCCDWDGWCVDSRWWHLMILRRACVFCELLSTSLPLSWVLWVQDSPNHQISSFCSKSRSYSIHILNI